MCFLPVAVSNIAFRNISGQTAPICLKCDLKERTSTTYKLYLEDTDVIICKSTLNTKKTYKM